MRLWWTDTGDQRALTKACTGGFDSREPRNTTDSESWLAVRVLHTDQKRGKVGRKEPGRGDQDRKQ